MGYCTLSGRGLILEANLAAAGLLGLARSALVQRPFSRFILKEDEDAYYLHHRRVLEARTPQVLDLRMLKFDGTVFWANLKSTVTEDAEGSPLTRIVMSDISVRMQAADSLRQSEAQKRALINAIPDPIFTNHRNGEYLDVIASDPKLLFLPPEAPSTGPSRPSKRPATGAGA